MGSSRRKRHNFTVRKLEAELLAMAEVTKDSNAMVKLIRDLTALTQENQELRIELGRVRARAGVSQMVATLRFLEDTDKKIQAMERTKQARDQLASKVMSVRDVLFKVHGLLNDCVATFRPVFREHKPLADEMERLAVAAQHLQQLIHDMTVEGIDLSVIDNRIDYLLRLKANGWQPLSE